MTEPAAVPEGRRRTSTSRFNWAYVDANHIAYYQSGAYPQRAAGTSPDFPILGTGRVRLAGLRPGAAHDDAAARSTRTRNAIDPNFLVSWNNKQAPRWSAADDKYSFGSVYRIAADRRLHRSATSPAASKMGVEQLVSAMDEAATQDIRIVRAVADASSRCSARPPTRSCSARSPRSTPGTPTAATAATSPTTTSPSPGSYQHNEAITIMDAWWPKLLEAEFAPALGAGTRSPRCRRCCAFGGPYPGGATGRARLRRRLVRLRQQGPARPARGERARRGAEGALLARLLRRRLAVELPASAAELAAGSAVGHAAADLRARRLRRKRPGELLRHEPLRTSASGVSVPPFPFQNRPTFQQVVELTAHAAALACAARAEPNQIGIPHSGNQRSSSGSIGSSSAICAFSCSSRSVLRSCALPGCGTNGYQ